jgi:hypothetical protein
MGFLTSIVESRTKTVIYSVVTVGVPAGVLCLWALHKVPFIIEVKVAIFLFWLFVGYVQGRILWWFFNRGS